MSAGEALNDFITGARREMDALKCARCDSVHGTFDMLNANVHGPALKDTVSKKTTLMLQAITSTHINRFW